MLLILVSMLYAILYNIFIHMLIMISNIHKIIQISCINFFFEEAFNVRV